MDPLARVEQQVDVGARQPSSRDSAAGGRAGRGRRLPATRRALEVRRDFADGGALGGVGEAHPASRMAALSDGGERQARPSAAAHHAVAWIESADIEAAGEPGCLADRSQHDAGSFLVEVQGGHEPVVSLVEGPAGRRRARGGRRAVKRESVRPPVRGHDLAFRVPARQERADEVDIVVAGIPTRRARSVGVCGPSSKRTL